MFEVVRVPREGATTSDPQSFLSENMLIAGSKNLMYRGNMELESVGGWKLANYGGLSSNRGGDVSWLVGAGWATIGDELNEGSGNIIEFVGRSLWFVGTGDITVWQPGITATPQALGNSALQNNIPQIAVQNESKNGYKTPVQVGLLQELNIPVIRSRALPGSGFAGLMNGTYAIQYTFIRESTGAESLPTEPSNVLSLTNQSLIIKFFGSTPTNAFLPRDKLRIYGTAAGFGGTGPFLFVQDVPVRRIVLESGIGYAIENPGSGNNVFRRNPTVTGYFSSEEIGKTLVIRDNTPPAGVTLHIARVTGVNTNTFIVNGVTYGDKINFTPNYSSTTSNTDAFWFLTTNSAGLESDAIGDNEFEIEYTDNQLAAIQPPTDFFPPATTAQFIVGLVNVMVLVGTEDGLGVAVSVPNFPEAFPPDFRMQLPEKPVGVLARPLEGFFYIVCANSVHEVRWTGAVDGPPVTLRTVAEQIGAGNQKAMAHVGNDIYMYTMSHKAARILASGSIDMSFADRVETELLTWNSGDVSVSYDERKNFVMYSYAGRVLLYYPAYDIWTPIINFVDQESAGKPDGNVESLFTLNGLIHQSHYFIYNPTVSINNGSNLANTAAPFWDHRHIGRVIFIPGAASGPSTLKARINSLNSNTQAVLSTTANITVSSVVSDVVGFDMWTFDRDITDIELQFSTNWAARFSYNDYGVGLNPKTVTRAKVGLKGTAGTYNLKFYRNYDSVNQLGPTRSFTITSGNHIGSVVDCNNGEGELMSVQLDGAGVRNKLFFIRLLGDESNIDTNFGV